MHVCICTCTDDVVTMWDRNVKSRLVAPSVRHRIATVVIFKKRRGLSPPPLAAIAIIIIIVIIILLLMLVFKSLFCGSLVFLRLIG